MWQMALLPYWGPVWQGIGFWQQWALFAPDVSNFSSRIFALIKYTDGSEETYDFGQGKRHEFSGWKLRQLIHDLVPRDRSTWKDVCLFVLRQRSSRDKIPKQISLNCRIKPIVNVSDESQSLKTFFVYEVLPGDLR